MLSEFAPEMVQLGAHAWGCLTQMTLKKEARGQRDLGQPISGWAQNRAGQSLLPLPEQCRAELPQRERERERERERGKKWEGGRKEGK